MLVAGDAHEARRLPRMTAYLLDVHHAIALWRNHPALVARASAATASGEAVLHLCLPVIGQMWNRIFNTPNPAENEKTLRDFIARFPLVDFDAAAAVEFGVVKTAMQKIRRPLPDVEAQVAAIARTRDIVVLSAEQHFSALPRLRVENWLGT